MRSQTIYLRPPVPPRPRKAVPKTARQEFSAALFKYRVQLLPFLAALWICGLAFIAGPETYGGTVLALAELALGWFLYQDRYVVPVWFPWVKLDRPVERWYAGACAGMAALWSLWATWGASKPEPRAIAALIILTGLCSIPWWHHRRIRGSVPVRFDNVNAVTRKANLEQARKIIQEWTAFTSAGHIQGAKIRAVTFNRWSVALAVQLRRGATIDEFTPRRLAKLESAYGDVQAGSARVERIDRHARLAVIRFMLDDPHEEPIAPPETGQSDPEKIILGLFETGEEMIFKLVNTLIGGATGSGKSGVINMLIRALARIPTVAIVGIDMKPGAPELGKWEKVMHALAKNPDEAKEVLIRLIEGLTYRGSIMSANRQRKWKPTRHQPFIVLIVDEIQELKTAKLMSQLDRLTALIRAYGGCVVAATQYPTTKTVSSEFKGNCSQRIGLRTEDQVGDRVIFGETGTRLGWRPHLISSAREGSFLVRSPLYKRPLLARAYWQDDDDVDRENETWAEQRTMIDDSTWNPVLDGTTVAAVESGTVRLEKGGEIVDAVIVDDDPQERVLSALDRGRTAIKDIMSDTGLSRPSVHRHLKALMEQGAVERTERGVYVRTAPVPG